MKKQRVSFSACFVGNGKSFIFVSGGFGAGRRVLNDCEIFNVNDNFWTLFPSMQTKRASHSLLLTENLKYIYAFGGSDEESQPLSSIERVRLGNPMDPTKDLNSEWQLIQIQLPEPIMNIGCYHVSAKDLIIFGGVNILGEKLRNIAIITVENEDRGLHSLHPDAEFSQEMEEGDSFSNCGNYYHFQEDTTIIINGSEFAWSLNLKDKKLTKFIALNE
jgi:hypothetical protein